MSFDPAPYADAIRAANEREQAAIKRRHEEAWAEARRLAALIRDHDPAVTDVFLFGSVAEGTPRRIDFDIDIAVSSGDIHLAMDSVADSAFEVDVVNLERIPDHVRRRILERGVRL